MMKVTVFTHLLLLTSVCFPTLIPLGENLYVLHVSFTAKVIETTILRLSAMYNKGKWHFLGLLHNHKVPFILRSL